MVAALARLNEDQRFYNVSWFYKLLKFIETLLNVPLANTCVSRFLLNLSTDKTTIYNSAGGVSNLDIGICYLFTTGNYFIIYLSLLYVQIKSLFEFRKLILLYII